MIFKCCEFCGKMFETRTVKKRFCCPKCRKKAAYLSDLLKEDEEIKKIVEKRGKSKEEEAKEAYIFRDWSIKEKDCAEAWAFIKTIKPIF